MHIPMRIPIRRPSKDMVPYVVPLALYGSLSHDADGSCVLLVAVLDNEDRVLGWTGLSDHFRPAFELGRPVLLLHDMHMPIDHDGKAVRGALVGVDTKRRAGLWASFPLGEAVMVTKGETFILEDFVITLRPDDN